MANRKTPKITVDEEGRRAGAPWAGLSRRQFLAGLAATTGALAVGGCGEDTVSGGAGAQSDPELVPLPAPELSGIEHVVVLMMENRSFDHFLGWLPGADGKQAGLTFFDKQGQSHPTYPLAPNFQNCQFEDPDHGYAGGREQWDNGANDGWLKASTDDLFPIGYYVQKDLSFYGGAVPAWTTFDRYFCSILAPTLPNRFYMHAAQTDRTENLVRLATMPTIWDRIAAKQGLTGAYYYTDLPILTLWGGRYANISKPIAQFFADAAAGTLPNVTYVDPGFNGDGSAGTSTDDHPLADIRNGQAFVSRIYDAVTASPNWPNTVFIINYDEWGGFFDHVPPPFAPQTELDPTTKPIANDGQLGFRVPCIMMSPLARRGFIGHHQYDHTSILSMIEWRWGLEPLTVRDSIAYNIAHALDFSAPKNLMVPHFNVPQGPFGGPCNAAAIAARPELGELQAFARRYGFATR